MKQIKFGIRLKELRQDKDLKQKDLAEVLGVSVSAVSDWEARGREPDFQMLCNIAEYFGVTIDDLLGLEI